MAKQGTGGAPASAAAGGLEAIFAALLAQASGSVSDATAPGIADPGTPAANHMAELLNGSAKLPTAAQGLAQRDAAKQKAANSNSILAGTSQRVARALKADVADGTTMPPAPAGKKDKDEHAAQAVSPAVAVAAPVQPVPAPTTLPASRPAEEQTAVTADREGTAAPKMAPGLPIDLTAMRVLAQQTLAQQNLHSAEPSAQNARPNPQHPAAEKNGAAQPQTASANPGSATQAAAAGAPGQNLEAALAALQAGAQKPATANPHADKAQPSTSKAVTALDKAAFAAAAEKAAHQDMPVQRTASTLSPGAQTASWSDAAQAQSGTTGSGSHGSDAQGRSDSEDGSQDKPASSPTTAPPTQAPAQVAQAIHAAAPSADPSASVQGAATSLQAPAHVSATLHVAPQGAAQAAPGQQGIALSDLGGLAVNIAAQSRDGAKQFNIALHPQDLGSIHVRLSVDHGGAAQAHLSADNPQTLTLLQRDSHLLERALKDAGLNLAGSGLNFSLKGQDRQNGSAAQPNGRSRNLSVTAVAGTNAPAAGPASTYNLAPDHVRLDIRV